MEAPGRVPSVPSPKSGTVYTYLVFRGLVLECTHIPLVLAKVE